MPLFGLIIFFSKIILSCDTKYNENVSVYSNDYNEYFLFGKDKNI